MSKRTLTDRFLKSLKAAPPGKRPIYFDAVVPGLGARVTDKGTVTFVLVARYPGSTNPTPRQIGKYGMVTLEEARKRARAWHEMLSAGEDPKDAVERDRLEHQRKQKNSFAHVAEDFIRREVTNRRRGADMERELRREFVARWGGRPITEIARHDVLTVLDEVVERGSPSQARALFGHVRRLYNWALGQGRYGLTSSPCDRLRLKDLVGQRNLRTRVLGDDEIRLLWHASGRLGYPFGPFYRLLLLTGLRRNEVADARWREFDLSKSLWTIPAERMKGGSAHVVPLTDEMLVVLSSLPRFEEGDHLFSTTFGRRPVSGFSKAKRRLDGRMGRSREALSRIGGRDLGPVPPWVIHDIRRTVRTNLSALPVSDLVRELILAHARPGLHRVYDQYAYLDERRKCLELWAKRLMSIVEPAATGASVVQLPSARSSKLTAHYL
jgi:integrase